MGAHLTAPELLALFGSQGPCLDFEQPLVHGAAVQERWQAGVGAAVLHLPILLCTNDVSCSWS